MMELTLLWVWGCAYLNLTGWTLSALHELNTGGYAGALLLGLVLIGWWRRAGAVPLFPVAGWTRLRRRFRRPFPAAFLILGTLAFLGGVIYPPTNYDALSYRLPRILHWLAAGQWHWIHSVFPRVNSRACGTEWVCAPLIAITRTDRLLFLINTVSFLLLPGLIYSVFTRLGVRPRVAWHWMWLVPTGYCFLLQAGSIGNDLFAAPFALAAVDFALRARHDRAARYFFASILAAALMTSAKTTALPLLLPWALAILPSWTWVLRRPLQTLAIALLAMAASFLPNALINSHYLHDWSGTKVENTGVHSDPVLRIPANLLLISVQNLNPPVFPLAGAWNHLVKTTMPPSLSLRLHQMYSEWAASEFITEEMEIEENAGLGFGVTLLLILSMAAALCLARKPCFFGSWARRNELWLVAVRFAPVVSLLALLGQSTIGSIARISSPYYPLLLPVFLFAPAHELLVKRCWWRVAAGVVFLLGALLLVISPARPLFPAQTILTRLLDRHPHSAQLERLQSVYQVYHERHDGFAPVLTQLPPDLKVLGLFTYDDPETSLWRPFGSRRIVHVCPGDTVEYLKQEGVEYILFEPSKLQNFFQQEPAAWVRSLNATVVQKIPLHLKASTGMVDWWLVQLP